jgi:hypothetical protein
MASNFDFSTNVVSSPFLDRIQRGDRIRDDLPRRQHQAREEPGGKDSGETSPEDIETPDEKETEKPLLDLRA